MKQPSTAAKLRSRATTLADILRYFTTGKRIFMLPVLILLFVTGILLILTGGLSYVAPFVYAIF
jgi:uncharacterized membrane protein